MTETLNLILIILISGGMVVFSAFFRSSRRASIGDESFDNQHYNIDALIDYVKECINEITRTNLFELGLNEVEFKKQSNKRAELNKALKQCMHGSLEDKQFIKSLIYDILWDYIPEEEINNIIPFNNRWLLSPREKFAIILYSLKKSMAWMHCPG